MLILYTAKAVAQPGRIFQQPYIASIVVTPWASGASYMYGKNLQSIAKMETQ